jgi:type I restriction enzyme S subunit
MFEAKDAAHMPADWTSVALGEVASCTLGGTPSTEIPQFWGGSIPWMASGDVHLRRIDDVPGRITAAGLASSNATLVSPPAVAIGLAGQGKTRGTVALTLCELATNQSIALVRGDPSRLQTEYLFHALDRRYEELRARSSGGGRGGLSKGILDSVPIDLPPLAEQEVITAVLDTLDTTIRQTEAIIAKLKQVKQGLLHDLLTRGIAANGELRPPHSEAPHLYKASPLGWIPCEWRASDVVSEFDVTSGLTLGPHRAPQYRPRKYLRVANVQRYRIDLTDVAELDATDAEMKSKQLLPGDLLIVEGHASTDEIGRCAMADEAVRGYTFQNHLFRLRAVNMDETFALHWMNSDFVRAYWRVEAATSSGLNTINRTKLDRLSVAVPPPTEQKEIVVIVEGIERRIELEQHQLAKQEAQKSGLMDDLLTGRVRVTPLLQGHAA